MKNLLQAFPKNHLDEIVFEHRNKAYGAYVLRNEYSSQLTKALFAGVAFFTAVAAIPMLLSAFHSDDVVKPMPVSIPFTLKNVDVPNVQKPVSVSLPANVKTVANPEYVAVRTPKKEVAIPAKKDFENAAIGTETKEGQDTSFLYVPASVHGSASTSYTPPAPVVPVSENPNKLISQNEADVAADFKGGINQFRQKVSQNFDTTAVDQSGVISAVITFVVEKDGSISNIKVTGNNTDFNREAERTIRSVKTKWSPALLKGQPMRSSFRMPISMQIQ